MTWINGYLLLGVIWAALSYPASIRARKVCGILLALYPLTGFVLTLVNFSSLNQTQSSYPWIPELGIRYATGLDPLGALFWLIITGIGTLVYIYGGAYLKEGHERLFPPLILFTVSMLGVTCAQDLATLFVAWELTSITSFVLIGFKSKSAEARRAALTALLVTGTGGLVLLVGITLLAAENGTFAFSELRVASPTAILLIAIGCFTKSAQFPFHFWLPDAMAAPTPISAFLHSATMVKAGVFLLAKFAPLFGPQPFITTVGTITLVVGSLLSLTEKDLKRILAWSTVAALGSMVALIGVGTDLALQALVVTILAHACYKGALFMSSGTLDLATGTRDVTQISGMAKSSPLLTGGMILAGLSMSGVPIFLGFVAKESALVAKLPTIVVVAFFIAGISTVVAAANTSFRPLFPPKPTQTPPNPPLFLAFGTGVLGLLGLVVPIVLPSVDLNLISPVVHQLSGSKSSHPISAFHGFDANFVKTVFILALGSIAAVFWPRAINFWPKNNSFSAQNLYQFSINQIQSLGAAIGRSVESLGFRQHMVGYFISFIALVWFVVASRPLTLEVAPQPQIRFNEVVIAGFAVVASIGIILARRRMGGVAILGIVGVAITLTYVVFGAPDLALTQLLIEVLTVVLFVIIFAHLPGLNISSSQLTRTRDALVAGAFGLTMAILVLAVLSVPKPNHIAEYFAQNSYELAKGRNVVNTIIVDFRGLDTLGEITVLCVAALGVHTLIRFRRQPVKGEQA